VVWQAPRLLQTPTDVHYVTSTPSQKSLYGRTRALAKPTRALTSPWSSLCRLHTSFWLCKSVNLERHYEAENPLSPRQCSFMNPPSRTPWSYSDIPKIILCFAWQFILGAWNFPPSTLSCLCVLAEVVWFNYVFTCQIWTHEIESHNLLAPIHKYYYQSPWRTPLWNIESNTLLWSINVDTTRGVRLG